MDRPLALPTVALFLGILLGSGHREGSFLAPLGLALSILLYGAADHFVPRRGGVRLFLIPFSFFFVGWWDATIPLTVEPIRLPEGRPIRVEGRVATEPVLSESGARFLFRPIAYEESGEWVPVPGSPPAKVRLFVPAPSPWLYRGESIRLEGRFSPIRARGNPRERGTAERWLDRGVVQRGVVRSPEGIVRWFPTDPSWRYRLYRWRLRIANAIASKIPNPESQLLRLLLLGKATAVPQRIREAWNGLGIGHLLAISGVHLGLVALLAGLLFRSLLRRSVRFMERYDIRKALFILILFPAFGYLLLAGTPTSALRAFMMLAVYSAAWLVGRESDLWSCFWAAAFLILLFDPHSAFEPSFQLSFAAVGSALLFYPRVRSLLKRFRGRSMLGYLFQTALVSGTILIGTFPIVAYLFHRWTPWALLANLVFVPWIGLLVLPFALLGVVVEPIGTPLATWLWHVAAFNLGSAESLIERWSRLPGADLYGPSLPLLSVLLWYLGVGSITLFRFRKRAILFGLLSFALSGGWFLWHREIRLSLQEPRSEVTFLNVGQGDASFIVTERGEGILIDGGIETPSGYDIGEQVIAPFLWSHPTARLTTVIASHWDLDHIGGLPFILQHFPVRELWTPPCPPSSRSAESLLDLAEGRGILVRRLSQGVYQTPSGERLQILHPPPDAELRFENDNDCSLVLSWKVDPYRFLFTGDIETSAEESLLQRGFDLSSTVLKVPHHGSRSSSSEAFIAAVHPVWALFSVGDSNRYGFPADSVVARYLRSGAKIWRTDLDGPLIIRIRHGEIDFKGPL